MFPIFKMSEDFCFGDICLKMPLFSGECETFFGNEKLFHNREVII